MKISAIYKKYTTPPNLREHLLLVTQIALLICDNWKGTQFDKNKLMKAALLHDLANIVKFDFVNHPEFLGEEQKNIDLWIERQGKTIKKYGANDHEATKEMLSEIGVDSEVVKIIISKSLGNSIDVAYSSNIEAKILLYADMRAGPFGVQSLNERLQDLTTRLEKYKNHPLKDQLITACKQIEKEIQDNCNVDLINITLNSFTHSNEELLETEL